jgi:hypothetical protein
MPISFVSVESLQGLLKLLKVEGEGQTIMVQIL